MRRLGAWMIAVLVLAAAPAIAATFTVTSTADGNDTTPGDGTCAAEGGGCTLRAAIQEANVLAGADTIAFAIPGAGVPVIAPARSLPRVTGAVIIDGTTHAAGRVVVDGAGAGAGASGLILKAPACTVRGLAIGRFGDGGIVLLAANGSVIDDTYVGIDADGVAPMPNGGVGIVVGASNVVITGSAVGYNGGDGVIVLPGTAGNRITQTRLVANAQLGIDLGDDDLVNPNDTRDTDAGANGLQNTPYLVQAIGGGTISISGGLHGAPSTSYTVEFFRSASCGATGEVYLGATSLTTDGNGTTTFTAPLPVAVLTPDAITATATAPDGSTSEFSNCVTVGAPVITTSSTTPTSSSSTTTTTTSSTTTSTTSTSSTTSTTTTSVTTTTVNTGPTTTLATTTTTSSTTTTTEPAIPTGPLPAHVRDPGGLALDDVGNVYLSDRAEGGIVVFDALTGASGAIVGGLTAPGDIEIRGCDVLIAETNDVVEQRLGISGRVLDFDFEPAANARVTVRSVSGQSSRTFATDADGRFAIALDFVPCELQGTLFVTVQSVPTADRPSRTIERPIPVRPGTPRRPFGHTVAEIVLPAP